MIIETTISLSCVAISSYALWRSVRIQREYLAWRVDFYKEYEKFLSEDKIIQEKIREAEKEIAEIKGFLVI